MTNLLADGIGRNIDWATFGIVVGIMSGVALVLALCIILISRFCQVKEDPVSRKWSSVLRAQTAALADTPAARALPRLSWKARLRSTPAGKLTRKRK